jgi:mRNA-degrading endonuclease toxin of MazEF toxin-antitoxin module
MVLDPDDLRYGQIVWAEVRDARGYRKRRPAIIVTPTHEICAEQPLVLVAVTTTFADPAPADHIELPWHPDRRRTTTGLARRSAAVVTWLATVYPDELDGIIGRTPARIMRMIQGKLDEMNEA